MIAGTLPLTPRDVLAVMRGQKTQHLRVIAFEAKPKARRGDYIRPAFIKPEDHNSVAYEGAQGKVHSFTTKHGKQQKRTSPFGVAGDVIAVLEDFYYWSDAKRGAYGGMLTQSDRNFIIYAAGPKIVEHMGIPVKSMHCSVHFTRISLLMQSVVVERLLDASEEDVIAMGYTDYTHFRNAMTKKLGWHGFRANPYVFRAVFSASMHRVHEAELSYARGLDFVQPVMRFAIPLLDTFPHGGGFPDDRAPDGRLYA